MIDGIKKILKGISYITTLVVTLIGIYTFISQLYIEQYGVENDNLQILNIKFKPNILFFDKTSSFYGDSNIIITVKNFGNKTIYLTSDKVEIKGNETLLSQCSGIGINRLSSNPNQSAVIKILPSEEKQLFLSKHISLKTIINYLNENNLSKALISKFDNDYLLHNIEIEKEFIKYMKQNFYNVSINIKLYTGYKKIIKNHTIRLYNNSSIFDTDGKIHYNSFLANLVAIKQGKIKYGFQ